MLFFLCFLPVLPFAAGINPQPTNSLLTKLNVESLRKHFYLAALRGLLKSMANRVALDLNYFDYVRLKSCFTATFEREDVRDMAKCLVTGFDAIETKNHLNLVGKQRRMKRYIAAGRMPRLLSAKVPNVNTFVRRKLPNLLWKLLYEKPKYNWRKQLRTLKQMRKFDLLKYHIPSTREPLVDQTTKYRQVMKILSNLRQKRVNIPSVLSPKLFSFFQRNSSSNGFLSPTLFDFSTFDYNSTSAWMDLFMETSGANDILQKFQNGKFALPAFAEKLNFIQSTWNSVQSTFSQKQRRQLENQKFTFLSGKQLRKLYGRGGPYVSNSSFSLADKVFYDKLSSRQRMALVKNDIRLLAEADRWEGQKLRDNEVKAREDEEQISFTTLSPAAFEFNILKPGVLGVVTLSPSAFIGEILSPGALHLSTLNPSAFVAAILSPVALQAVSLSPTAFGSAVLSPAALASSVLSPEAFVTSVLSPSALTPAVLSPKALFIEVLSPHTLSPAVLSPSALGVVVLSPSALSPAVASEGNLVVEILSPALLS